MLENYKKTLPNLTILEDVQSEAEKEYNLSIRNSSMAASATFTA